MISCYWWLVSILRILLYICYIRLCRLSFLSCSLNLYLFWILFPGFWTYRIFLLWLYHILLFLYLVTLCVVFSSNVEKVRIFWRFLCRLWFLRTFCCLFDFFKFCHYFKILLDFLLFLWIVLDCFYCRLWRMLGVFRCYVFFGFRCSFCGIFSLIRIPYLSV